MIHTLKLRIHFEWRLKRRKFIRLAEKYRAAFWKAENGRVA